MNRTSKGLFMENRKTQKVAAAFLLGAIVGGVIALLYAPKSGKETRKDISEDINNYMKKAGEAKNKIIEKAEKFSNDMVGQTERVYSDVKRFKEGKYSGTAEKIESEITRLRTAIKAAIDSYKDTRKARRLFQDDEEESLPKFKSMRKQSN
jgi:gas vesicle protein